MSTRETDRRLGLALAGLTLVALVLRAWGLAEQPVHGDDLLAGATARNFVEFGWPGPTMWQHPRLRDLLVRWSVGALGANAWGLKFWSVLVGTLCVPATGYLVRIVGASRAAAILAAAIVATDPLHVDFSRQAINDVYVSFFPVVAILALFAYGQRRRPWMIVAAGLFLALGMASKWSAAFPVAAAAALTIPAVVSAAGSLRARLAEIALDVAALVLLPMAVYLLTFWPWFGRGHGLLEFVRFQGAMGSTAVTTTGFAGTMVNGFQGYQIGAWRWFLQPVWWVDAIAPARAGGSYLFLPGVGNPLTWLATLPAAAWATWRWLRARDRAAGIVLVLWLAAYLPFVLVPRPIWTNAAVIVVPFWAALVGLAAAHLWERSRVAVTAWAVIAVGVALLLWVPVTGRRSGPSDAAIRALVPPLALDPSSHPTNTFSDLEGGP